MRIRLVSAFAQTTTSFTHRKPLSSLFAGGKNKNATKSKSVRRGKHRNLLRRRADVVSSRSSTCQFQVSVNYTFSRKYEAVVHFLYQRTLLVK
jgi:hypothetical protein